MNWLTWGLLAFNSGLLVLLVLRSRGSDSLEAVQQRLDDVLDQQHRLTTELERSLRDDVARTAALTRQELTSALGVFQQSVLKTNGEAARTLNEQMARLHQAVDQRLQQIQAESSRKLEEMRQTVDEKLHATLEQRLGESFKQVAERLEQVHKGLGEMHRLASDVGALSRVLGNVKTRGVFGEVQLAALLEQVLTPDQYATNIETVPSSGARVEFAVKLPGAGQGAPVWLPIDAKFPRDDYERLLDAHDRADAQGVDASSKAIEVRLKLEAKQIRDKYVAPPHTTDFAILFVPTEGLYAEALRRPGLVESLQRDYRVMLAGPTTLLATLNSLQMGFRTLALERRSSEVWEVLGAVKTEFGKFGDALARTRRKLEEASSNITQVETRTRVMGRALKDVEALPETGALSLAASVAHLNSDPSDGSERAV